MTTPAALDRAETPAPVPPTTVRDFVARLNRLVQRTATYPDGHALVRLAAAPFVDSLRETTHGRGRVMVMVSRDALLVVAGAAEPVQQIVPWLSTRLFDRGVAAITFEPTLDVDEALNLARWLGAPGATSLEAPVEFAGASVKPCDFSRVRFVEEPAVPEETGDEGLRVWRAIASELAPDDVAGADLDDPEILAAYMRQMLAANEGGGVGALAGRITKAGRRLNSLGHDVHAPVTRKLGALVSALSPELRMQLLSVGPTDHPDKLSLLANICGSLTQSAKLEMLRATQLGQGRGSDVFVNLLVRLVELSTEDPALSGALEAQFAAAGLPTDVVHYDRDAARSRLFELLGSDAEEADAVSKPVRVIVAEKAFDPALFCDPAVTLDAEPLNAIALHLLESATTDTERLAAATHLGVEADTLVTKRRDDLVARTALAFERANEQVRSPELRGIVDRFRESCRSPVVVESALGRLRGRVTPLPEDLALLRAGLPESADALVAALVPATAPRGLRVTLAHLDANTLTAVLERARATNGLGRLLGILHDVDPARALEAAFGALGEGDADVRVEAYRVLLVSQAPLGRIERVVARALADPDPRAAVVALDVVRRQPTSAAIAAVATHLSEPTRSRYERVDLAAVTLLTNLGTPEALQALSRALLARRRYIDRRSRKLSRSMARALEPASDLSASKAARAWRWSMAGLVSRALRDAKKEKA